MHQHAHAPGGPGLAADMAAGTHEVFRPASAVLGVLEDVLKHEKPVRLTVAGAGCVWVDPETRVYVSQLESAERFFTASPKSVQTKSVDAPGAAHARRPIDELLWAAGWYGSAGALHERCRPIDVVQIKYWPNLTRVPHGLHSARIAALLSQAPYSVWLACRSLHVPPTEMFRFYSAATAAGMVRVINGADVSAKAEPPRPSKVGDRVAGFWNKMLDRIMGL